MNRKEFIKKFEIFSNKYLKKRRLKSDCYSYIAHDHRLFVEGNVLRNCYLVGSGWKDSSKPIIVLIGFNDWKLGFMASYFENYRVAVLPRKINTLRAIIQLRNFKSRLNIKEIAVWGYNESKFLRKYIGKKFTVRRIEDAFVRSSRLGAEHTVPYSISIDNNGIYYDPNSKSLLSNILSSSEKSENYYYSDEFLLKEIIDRKISKYNPPINKAVDFLLGGVGRKILVLGQVDNDAAIRYGNPESWTSEELVKLAYHENPGATVFYRPHPEVFKGYQRTSFRKKKIEKFCYVLSPETSVIDEIERADHIYTITSLTGFEAILRKKKVTVVGDAFYSQLGLTDDRYDSDVKGSLSIQSAFNAVYLKYPSYLADPVDPTIGLMATVNQIESDRVFGYYFEYIKKSEKNLNSIINCSNDYLPFFLVSKDYRDVINTGFEKINFSSVFPVGAGRDYKVFILCFLYGIFENYKDFSDLISKLNRNIDLESFSLFSRHVKKINKELYNELMVSFGGYLAEEGYFSEAKEKIELSVQNLKSENENKVSFAEGEEKIDFDGFSLKEISENDKNKLIESFNVAYNKNCYDLAIELGCVLGLVGLIDNDITLKIAKCFEMVFDVKSAFYLYKFSFYADPLHANKAALKGVVDNVGFVLSDKKAIEKWLFLLMFSGRTGAVRESCDIAGRLGFFEKNDPFFYPAYGVNVLPVIRLMSPSIKKSVAYMDHGFFAEALDCMEALAAEKTLSLYEALILCNCYILNSKYHKAVYLMASLYNNNKTNKMLATEYLRMLRLEGDHKKAFDVIDEIENSGIFLDLMHYCPFYLIKHDIFNAFNCYLETPTRKNLMSLFGDKYIRDVEDINSGNLKKIVVLPISGGPGDEIRYITIYADILKEFQGQDFYFVCSEQLIPLFSRTFEGMKFIPTKRSRSYDSFGNGVEVYSDLPDKRFMFSFDGDCLKSFKDYDGFIQISDFLPLVRPAIESFYRKDVLLKVHDKMFLEVRNRVLSASKGNFKVGISWRSSVLDRTRWYHYLMIKDILGVLSIDGITFYNLQYDECYKEVNSLPSAIKNNFVVFDDIDLKNDFDNTSALIKSMDLVIAPCTTIAELAGSLGVKTLLFSTSEEMRWRVKEDGSDIWFPSISHVFSDEPCDRKSLVENLIKAVNSSYSKN